MTLYEEYQSLSCSNSVNASYSDGYLDYSDSYADYSECSDD